MRNPTKSTLSVATIKRQCLLVRPISYSNLFDHIFPRDNHLGAPNSFPRFCARAVGRAKNLKWNARAKAQQPFLTPPSLIFSLMSSLHSPLSAYRTADKKIGSATLNIVREKSRSRTFEFFFAPRHFVLRFVKQFKNRLKATVPPFFETEV